MASRRVGYANRREFIAGSLAAVLALHRGLQLGGTGNLAMAVGGDTKRKKPAARLQSVRLQTHALAELKRFYGEIFGLPLADATDDRVAIAAGESRLEFAQATGDARPFYHFAFNIPENQLEEARRWLAKRVPVLRDTNGEEVIHFERWNAHAIYYRDPAGNVGELIARHTLDNAAAGAFGVEKLLCVSEIALIAPDDQAVSRRIQKDMGLPRYLGSDTFLGDANGIVIVFPTKYAWLPDRKTVGRVFPTQVRVSGCGGRRVGFDDLPFVIQGDSPTTIPAK